MTLTTLIGLTKEEYDRAKKDFDREIFLLDEIDRYYAERRRRRAKKSDIMRKISYATSIITDFDKWQRCRAKIEKMNRHEERDRICWYAVMDKKSSLLGRWIEMNNELKASKAVSA